MENVNVVWDVYRIPINYELQLLLKNGLNEKRYEYSEIMPVDT